ncbi:cytochrome c biogenesis heme-transporting ATPase CcmA [Candidatus Methylospira mobilis]|uniref:Cytochrome c biogenesis heme-transporting ATPase CcmA n=1 Tax=Candidatus Methylospira mobilis TaxID=1808979 RepID=A0A5Q0BDM4_9GAMM|nr:cytochrome c biogenesis heme-transporting ATPase CcmA [Candidatus Methylospira mobilis]QFY41639.1 cytochrome c biogenesis heme-transporting ATPase CcmA [Candidatus Methylospira mobilis]WNV05110.1 cytochrome c biogenesis heme-transporting ATPase CcmA [Candidatus Methylospira mobilis]
MGILTARNLECVRSERELFSQVGFTLSPGCLLQVEGANGSGKTSLLRIVAGLSRPAEGEVLWRGRSIAEHTTDYQAEMAYLGHALGVKADLTALENLLWFLPLTGIRLSETVALTLLAHVGLDGCEGIPARKLSAGQNQRIALARIVARSAALWILDEPFTALDIGGVALLGGLLDAHLETGGMAIVTSHQPLVVSCVIEKLVLS